MAKGQAVPTKVNKPAILHKEHSGCAVLSRDRPSLSIRTEVTAPNEDKLDEEEETVAVSRGRAYSGDVRR